MRFVKEICQGPSYPLLRTGNWYHAELVSNFLMNNISGNGQSDPFYCTCNQCSGSVTKSHGTDPDPALFVSDLKGTVA
jgi:hypothetical protein